MAKTPYTKIGSQDILSAHISGLQFAVNNLEDALNLKTQAVTGHTLTPVTDMDDPTIRYRIYEGNVRSWLSNPDPVIKRNGAVVPSSEYDIQPAYGVIVFHAQQEVTATISADFNFVIDESERLETIESNISEVSAGISEVSANVSEVDNRVSGISTTVGALSSRVTTLEQTGGGSGGGGDTGGGGLSAYPTTMFAPRSSWISNNASMEANTATEVIIGAGAIDAFPIILNERMTLAEMKVIVSPNNKKSATNFCGIYSNKDVYPNQLLATTNSFRVELAMTAGDGTTKVKAELVHPLTTPITLDAGIYWLARYSNDGVSFDGWNMAGVYGFYIPDADLVNGTAGNEKLDAKIAGVRADKLGSISALPATFPALGGNNKYLARSTFGGIYIKRA